MVYQMHQMFYPNYSGLSFKQKSKKCIEVSGKEQTSHHRRENTAKRPVQVNC